jgi:outer membrane protein TolC
MGATMLSTSAPCSFASASEKDGGWNRNSAFNDFTSPPQATKRTLTLSEAVDIAIRDFPSIPTARYRLRAAKADISLAKTAYLPNFNLDMQEMRSTQNVIAGTIMPQAMTFDTIPVQSGKEGSSSTFKSIWATNQAANFNWLLYDFGLRGSNVELAQAQAKLARANLRLTELDVAFAAAESYLNIVAAEQTIRAAKATVNRMEAASVTARTMVSKGLQPGVDAARADYDVSQSKIALIKAERATELARVDLAERLGVAGSYINVVAEPLVIGPARAIPDAAVNLESHPLALLETANVKTWAAKVHVLDRSWYPHLWLNSAIWGRGSGATGQSPPVAGGILPQVGNYMAGLSLSFPVLDYFPIRARKQSAINNQLAQTASLDLALQILQQKNDRARVLLSESRRIAEETPHLVQAARQNEIKVLERYEAGLTNMVAVAEAERILAEAEVEDALAWIEVWRSILALGYVQGDLKPFLQLVSAAGGK